MAARMTPASLFNPVMLWADLAMKGTEMLVASGQVIGSRVDQMARAGTNPSPRDVQEFSRMGSEKLQAATESGLAIALRMQSTNYQLMARAWQQWFAACGAMASLGASRSWGEALTRQNVLYQALARSGHTNARLSSDAARLGSAAMAPFHSASTANARRLRRAAARIR